MSSLAEEMYKVEQFVKDNKFGTEYWNGQKVESGVRFRQDFEIIVDVSRDDAIGGLFVMAKKDLKAVIQNGDVNNVADPLLKAMDGAVKRGSQPESVNIHRAVVYRESRPAKGAYEYTMYLVLDVQWKKK